jgi:hypothetical protein
MSRKETGSNAAGGGPGAGPYAARDWGIMPLVLGPGDSFARADGVVTHATASDALRGAGHLVGRLVRVLRSRARRVAGHRTILVSGWDCPAKCPATSTPSTGSPRPPRSTKRPRAACTVQLPITDPRFETSHGLLLVMLEGWSDGTWIAGLPAAGTLPGARARRPPRPDLGVRGAGRGARRPRAPRAPRPRAACW